MIRPGDTVRYLNDVGGGKVIRVEGSIAYVDDEGFETPVRTSELVVVLPAGHKAAGYGKKYFDQSAYDAGRSADRPQPEPEPAPAPVAVEEEDFPVEETEYGDDMTVVIAFEPVDIKKLTETDFNVLLVNDSNYFLDWQLLLRREEGDWETEAKGTAAPNELVEAGRYTRQSVHRFERFVFQAISYKKEKPFEIKSPISVSRKVDMSKLFKLHCFRPTTYFEDPVIEVPIIAETSRVEVLKPSKKKR